MYLWHLVKTPLRLVTDANSNPANQDLGSGQFSIAMGRESWAKGTDNISIGHNAKTDSSGDSIAIGRDSTSNSVNTVTIGAQTKSHWWLCGSNRS